MTVARLISIASSLALGACTLAPVDGEQRRQFAAGGGDTRPVQLADNFEATTWTLDPYAIESAELDGAVLRVVVRYGGGCSAHRFSLVASRAFRESMPVQVSAVLTHDAAGDACRALLSDTLRYDLTPLRDEYRRAYRTQSGAIVMHLWHQEKSVRYEF